jgi:hypothetical protein
MKQVKHTCIAITTCEISRSSFATLIYNTCNIPLKHLKHTLTACASQGMPTVQRTLKHMSPLPADVRGWWGRGRMPPLPLLPRWARWMKVRHEMVAQTAGVANDGVREQPGDGHGCGTAALEKPRRVGVQPATSGPAQLRWGRRATLSFFWRYEAKCATSGGTHARILSLLFFFFPFLK